MSPAFPGCKHPALLISDPACAGSAFDPSTRHSYRASLHLLTADYQLLTALRLPHKRDPYREKSFGTGLVSLSLVPKLFSRYVPKSSAPFVQGMPCLVSS